MMTDPWWLTNVALADRIQCPTCGNYRIDGGPPLLHKCQRCGFVGGPDVHTDQCPGCLYRESIGSKIRDCAAQ